jgi:hypothetical protein
MKKFRFIVLCVVLAVAGCDFFMGPDAPAGNGEGNLVISFGDSPALAVSSGADLPSGVLASLRYELSLTGPGGEALAHSVPAGGSLSLTVALGDWRIDAEAYQRDILAGTGSLGFTVVPGTNSIRVPMMINGGYFDIGIASVAGGTVRANFQAAFPGTRITVTATPDPDHIFKDGSLKYNDGSDHVSAGSSYTFTMPAADITVRAEFAQTGFTVTSDTDFASALAAIQAGAADLRYTVTAGADISLSPQDLTLADFQNKTVVLKGNDPARTITLDSPGSLFTVGTDVTLELEDITVEGIDTIAGGNNVSLITVQTYGELHVNEGAKIINNEISKDPEVRGGGVYVGSNAALYMSGGEISGNSVIKKTDSFGTYCYGGGVYVDSSGTFVMDGGEISNNLSGVDRTTSRGGGVYVAGGASFTMNGGKISANKMDHNPNFSQPSSEGMGVYIAAGAYFTMNNGEISGNVSSDRSGDGAGVWNAGPFIMNGGIIKGNGFGSDTNTSNGYGGGVYVQSAGTLTKIGGIIYGSNEIGNDDNGKPLKNTAQTRGAAVYYSSTKFRETTVGLNQNLSTNNNDNWSD